MIELDLRFDGRDALLIFLGYAVWIGLVPTLPRTLPLEATWFVVLVGVLPLGLPFVRRWWLGPPARRLLRHGRWWPWLSMGALVLFSVAAAGLFLASLVAYRLVVEPAGPFDLGAAWHERGVGLPWLAGSLAASVVLAVIAFIAIERRYQRLSP